VHRYIGKAGLRNTKKIASQTTSARVVCHNKRRQHQLDMISMRTYSHAAFRGMAMIEKRSEQDRGKLHDDDVG